jgi:pimeloyl-ACP methyl ester carboxylesterase
MGDEDHMFLPAVRCIVTKHTNSWLEVIGNSGHVCNVDQPKEFNARAILFLKKISSCSSQDETVLQLASC